MCIEYCINGKIISTQGELAKEITQEKIAMIKDYLSDGEENVFNPEHCLCGVDAWQTAKNIGLPVMQTAMYYHFGDNEISIAIKWEKKNKGWWTDENGNMQQ